MLRKFRMSKNLGKFFLSTFLLSSVSDTLSSSSQKTISVVGNWQNMSTSCTTTTTTSCASKYSIGYITVPNSNLAKELAKKLVIENMVACVNIVPTVTSIYKWQDKLEEDDESLMILKTRTEKINNLVEFVKRNHPYDVPEIIFAPIQGGNPDYLKWVSKSVQLADDE